MKRLKTVVPSLVIWQIIVNISKPIRILRALIINSYQDEQTGKAIYAVSLRIHKIILSNSTRITVEN